MRTGLLAVSRLVDGSHSLFAVHRAVLPVIWRDAPSVTSVLGA